MPKLAADSSSLLEDSVVLHRSTFCHQWGAIELKNDKKNICEIYRRKLRYCEPVAPSKVPDFLHPPPRRKKFRDFAT